MLIALERDSCIFAAATAAPWTWISTAWVWSEWPSTKVRYSEHFIVVVDVVLTVAWIVPKQQQQQPHSMYKNLWKPQYKCSNIQWFKVYLTHYNLIKILDSLLIDR